MGDHCYVPGAGGVDLVERSVERDDILGDVGAVVGSDGRAGDRDGQSGDESHGEG